MVLHPLHTPVVNTGYVSTAGEYQLTLRRGQQWFPSFLLSVIVPRPLSFLNAMRECLRSE